MLFTERISDVLALPTVNLNNRKLPMYFLCASPQQPIPAAIIIPNQSVFTSTRCYIIMTTQDYRKSTVTGGRVFICNKNEQRCNNFQPLKSSVVARIHYSRHRRRSIGNDLKTIDHRDQHICMCVRLISATVYDCKAPNPLTHLLITSQ